MSVTSIISALERVKTFQEDTTAHVHVDFSTNLERVLVSDSFINL